MLLIFLSSAACVESSCTLGDHQAKTNSNNKSAHASASAPAFAGSIYQQLATYSRAGLPLQGAQHGKPLVISPTALH
jgi:hypothetical protein